MITRQQYMANSEKLHQAYYLEIAQAAGMSLPGRLIAWCRKSTDPHFNDISLVHWDALHQQWSLAMVKTMKDRGCGGVALSDVVCAAKALARHIIGTS